MSVERAGALLDLGRHAEALEVLGAVPGAESSAYALGLRTRALLGLKRLGPARESAAAMRRIAPHGEWGYRLGAIVERSMGRPADALALADQAAALDPQEPFTHQVAVLCALDIGDLRSAGEHASAMLELAPDTALAHVTLARVQIASSQLVWAEASLRRALTIDSADDVAMALLAEVVAKERPEEARQLRVAALRADPQDVGHRRRVLSRGRAMALGGAAVTAGKLGLVGKFAALSVLSHAVRGQSGRLTLAVMTVIYLATFAVSRVRRRRHGRKLPPLVWEGTRADRRNADLLWLGVPAALVAVISAVVILVRAAAGVSPVGPVVWFVAALVVLAVCWRFRAGEVRDRALAEVLRDVWRAVVRTVSFNWQRRGARRRRRRGQR
ncbi:MAG: hypothetical protein ACTHMS_16685 [Jatrophihabitans sp.]|uniref:hypothetical protein n=1 Tax=Jatrophihabitans sp. TaxID=1932789 RepID=UPI003F80BAA1